MHGLVEMRERSRSTPRLSDSGKGALSPRKSVAVLTPNGAIVIPPPPSDEPSATDRDYVSHRALPTRKSSLFRLDGDKRRPSLSPSLDLTPSPSQSPSPSPSTSDAMDPCNASPHSNNRMPSMTRRSLSSSNSRKASNTSLDFAVQHADALNGWDEQQAAIYNREYISVMKSKGIKVQPQRVFP